MTRAGSSLYFAAYHLPPGVDLLYRGTETVPLEPRAVRVLRYLANHHDRVISKNELLEEVWSDVFTTDGVLKKAISQIRRTLGDDADEAKFIATYHGRGYRFIAPVRRVESGSRRRESTPGIPSPFATNRHVQSAPNYDQLKGRDGQLAALRSEFASALRGEPRPVVITGEPGIGKTQLARHFRRWARDQRAIALYGRFFDYNGARLAPFELFLDLLGSAAHAATGDSNLKQTLETRCGVMLPPELLGESSAVPAADPLRFVFPIVRAWLALARIQPIVLVLDDLQWADDASLDIIGSLMRMLQSEPLMLLVLVRSAEEQDARIRGWLQEQAARRSYTTLRLEPLNEAACSEVAGAVFHARRSGEIPPRDLQRLYRLTGGNPYFLIETLRLLVSEKVIVLHGDGKRWVWKGLANLKLPETIVTATRARIDRLAKPVAELLEQAAVIGEEFRVATLALVSGLSEPRVETLLSDAVAAGILSTHGLSLGEDCRFQHSLLRHVVYEAIPPPQKRRLHARAAEAIETVYARELDRMAEALSEHFAAAANHQRTFEASLHAYRIAASRSEWRKAAALVERAVQAAEAVRTSGDGLTIAQEAALQLARAESLFAEGRIRDAAPAVQQAAQSAERAEDRAALARTLVVKGAIESARSDFPAARASLLSAVDLYAEAGDEEGRCRAVIHLANVENALGKYTAAAALVEDMAGSHSSDEVQALARAILGWSVAHRGDPAKGKELLEDGIRYHEATGNIRERAGLLHRLHRIELARGSYETAIELATSARADSITVGDVLGEARANLGIGHARIAQGRLDEGISFVNRTVDRLHDLGDARCEAEACWLLGRALSERGQTAEAAQLISRALATVRGAGDREGEMRMLIEGRELASLLAEDQNRKPA